MICFSGLVVSPCKKRERTEKKRKKREEKKEKEMRNQNQARKHTFLSDLLPERSLPCLVPVLSYLTTVPRRVRRVRPVASPSSYDSNSQTPSWAFASRPSKVRSRVRSRVRQRQRDPTVLDEAQRAERGGQSTVLRSCALSPRPSTCFYRAAPHRTAPHRTAGLHGARPSSPTGSRARGGGSRRTELNRVEANGKTSRRWAFRGKAR